MDKQPNLFTYATKELSQDALICYMLEWADKKNAIVDIKSHRAGKKLLDGFFGKYKNIVKPDEYEIEIKRQYKKIDVLCIVNKIYYIIVEDKTNETHHSNQLSRYYEVIHEEEKIAEENILCIYYKSGEEYNLDQLTGQTKAGNNWEYKLFSKKNILTVLEEDTDNQILKDYKEYIEKLEEISSYKNLDIDKWKTNSWISFVRDLKMSGLSLGEEITDGKGKNKGIYFNYKIIDSDKVGFYLRISFDTKQIQFKLENKGNAITNELQAKYYALIDEALVNELFQKHDIKKGRSSSKASITRIIVTIIKSFLITDDNKKLDFDKTKIFIESVVSFHNKLVEKARV